MKGQVETELYERAGGRSCMKGQVGAELYERSGGCRVV